MADRELGAHSGDLHLDRGMQARLEQRAATRQQLPDVLLGEAVAQYVDREEKRQRFEQDAVDSWRHYKATGLHVTDEEVFAWFRKLRAGEKAASPECHT